MPPGNCPLSPTLSTFTFNNQNPHTNILSDVRFKIV
uniref:Uncharacterized protein n=1 Tax=Anguilla anguilla TaxID=7936 RepID=A0A0E9WHF9_ANGAN